MRPPLARSALPAALALGLTSLALAAACLGPGTLNEEGACDTDGRGVLEAQCSSCHASTLTGRARGGAPEGYDFDGDADVARHAEHIGDVLEDGTMPPSGPLSACERALLEGYVAETVAAPCAPACAGRVCGDDGCAGSCGECEAGSSCVEDAGQCLRDECRPACVGKVCGDDGCGGTCGACAAGERCEEATGTCAPIACAPACGAAVCGDDGCGGSCGACAAGEDCADGACVPRPPGFTQDVWPIVEAKGCANSRCHAGAQPDAGLDLRSAAIAYAAMVDVPSTQCPALDLVEPKQPDQSYLVNKLTGVGMCGDPARIGRMPRGIGATPLSAAQLDAVRAWIEAGALP